MFSNWGTTCSDEKNFPLTTDKAATLLVFGLQRFENEDIKICAKIKI